MTSFNRALFILVISFLVGCTPNPIASDDSEQPSESQTDLTEETAEPVSPAMAVIGPREVVFDWSHDACEPDDIPDLPARAFRDSEGFVHLISSHIEARAKVGSSLDEVVHQCAVIMESDHDGNPANFNDNEWIAATYTEDGETVYAIVHHEYHGWEHNDCGTTTVNNACWYNSLTLAVSYDGGTTFDDAAPPPEHFVAGLPYPYEAGAGPYGTLEPSNILRAKDGYYYQIIRIDDIWSTRQWLCLQRTNDLSDPDSWRGWDGEGFNMRFISIYENPDANPEDHLCEAISPEETGLMAQSLTYNTFLDRYVLLGLSADHIGGREVWGIYYSFSDDLIHWTRRQLLWERELNWTWQPGDDQPIGYPTLIDPNSPSLSFDTTDEQAYLYFTYYNPGSSLDRDLIRIPVGFFKSQEEARAADTRTELELQQESATSGLVVIGGELTRFDGMPLADQAIILQAELTIGSSEYHEYQVSGKIPEGATRAILGYRTHIECDCEDNTSELWLYELRFETESANENLVSNPNFANGLSGANLWNGPSLATIETSDQGEGNMLHVLAESGQTSAGDLASFSVSAGEIYRATFGARISPEAERTGIFVLVFLSNNRELVRYPIYFYTPQIIIGEVTTGPDGAFEFEWSNATNGTLVEAVFHGDESLLPSSATITVRK